MSRRTLGSRQNVGCRYSVSPPDLVVLEAMSDGPRCSTPKFGRVALSRQLLCSPGQVVLYICT